MALPRGTEYDLAVQNPKISFNDPDLKISSVETTPLGLPKPYSGGFTTTFRLKGNTGDWAVRCFTREIQDLQKRYVVISEFLSSNKSKYFVPATYLPDGIRVSGKPYPIIKMKWLKGVPLNLYISDNIKNKSKIENLLKEFQGLVGELQSLGIAHGDLQHGNIMVEGDSLYLIDYDGMYFPALAGLPTNEVGHINYQHPQRTASDYNKEIDRFASIVIYLGLKALTIKPDLWKKYDDGESMLFKKGDYADLQQSLLISELNALPGLQDDLKKLIGICYLPFGKIPSLETFISGKFELPANVSGKITISRSQYLVLDGSSRGSLLEHVGERIELVGRISAVKSGTTKYGDPYLFVNFGGSWPNHASTLAIWSEALSAFEKSGVDLSTIRNKWVSVTGVINVHQSIPQIEIEQVTQLQFLSGEDEANNRLRLKPAPRTSRPQPIIPSSTASKEKDVFTGLYGNKPATSTVKHTESSNPFPIGNSTTSTPPPISRPSIPVNKTTTTTTTPPRPQKYTPTPKSSSGCMLLLLALAASSTLFIYSIVQIVSISISWLTP